MQITILGATGRIGSLVLANAQAARLRGGGPDAAPRVRADESRSSGGEPP